MTTDFIFDTRNDLLDHPDTRSSQPTSCRRRQRELAVPAHVQSTPGTVASVYASASNASSIDDSHEVDILLGSTASRKTSQSDKRLYGNHDATRKIEKKIVEAFQPRDDSEIGRISCVRGGSNSSSDSSSGSTCKSSPSSTSYYNMIRGSGESTHRKRAMDNGDSESEDDPSRPRKRSRLAPSKEQAEERTFACPYYKRDPWNRWSRACGATGWKGIHRLKEHLYRKHRRPFECERCLQSFPTESDRQAHQRSAIGCHRAPHEPELYAEGITAEQEKRLKSRKGMSSIGDVYKWRAIYQILFPDVSEDSIPSPYYEDSIAGNGSSAKDYDVYLQSQLPKCVQRALEQEIEKDLPSILRPVIGVIRQRLPNIVQDCLKQVSQSFPLPGNPILGTLDECANGPDRHPSSEGSQHDGLTSTPLFPALPIQTYSWRNMSPAANVTEYQYPECQHLVTPDCNTPPWETQTSLVHQADSAWPVPTRWNGPGSFGTAPDEHAKYEYAQDKYPRNQYAQDEYPRY